MTLAAGHNAVGAILNDLDQLPPSCRVALVGAKGRNARFERVLQFLRPDIIVHARILLERRLDMDCKIQPERHGLPDLSQVDYVLLTSCRQRDYDNLLVRLPEVRFDVLIVNPNFYHPFMIFDPGEYEDQARKLAAAQAMLPFAEDREIYRLVLATLQPKTDLRREYAKGVELCGRMGRQYFDHINPAAIRTVIEGGVADGWNAVQFLASFPAAVVYGFEPDRRIFENGYYRDCLLGTGRFHYFPLGLWERSGRLRFEVNKACMSRVSKDADNSPGGILETTSIDEFVLDHGISKIDFIKLDIEGSEWHALLGARQTIAKHRPQLAVCIYHRLEHYYQIPLLLADCAEDYVFRSGHYSPFHIFSETVLYAIPKESCHNR